MSRRSSSKRARRQSSSLPILAESTITSEVAEVTEQLITPEIISEPVEDVVSEDMSSNTKPRTAAQELNEIPEYQKGSKASFFKTVNELRLTLIDPFKSSTSVFHYTTHLFLLRLVRTLLYLKKKIHAKRI